MENIWVLSVRTSLPELGYTPADIEVTFKAYDTFEKGRDAMRDVIKNYVYNKNSMFDGEGNITYLKKYWEEMWDEEYVDDFGTLDKRRLGYVIESLQRAFAGENIEFEMESDSCTDWMIEIEAHPGSVRFYGVDDGPCNGYNPDIRTNIFSMEQEQDYYLYINDLLGQDDFSSELYIDLKKVTIQK